MTALKNEVRLKRVPRSRRVAFTGYRPQKMPFGFDENDPRCVDFKKRLHDTIENFIWQGYTHFISGGGMDMDTFAAEIVLELKTQYPEITLKWCLPSIHRPPNGKRATNGGTTGYLMPLIS